MHITGMNAALAALAMIAVPALAAAGEAGHQGGWNGPGLPSVTRWGDTYAGAVSTAGFRHGTYFHVERPVRPVFSGTRRPDIRDARRTACAYEAGVCVIRP